jgi:hypothetical protein
VIWLEGNKATPAGAALADRHYNRRKVGSPQFMPPGETLVLVSACARAVWGWWRPHPASGLKAMNGLDGWTCSIFRNEGAGLSSDLILEAEAVLRDSNRGCGPDGMLSYVWPSKIRSTNPGACFLAAGWRRIGWSQDRRKRLLWKPFELAGVAACPLWRHRIEGGA